MTVKVGLSIMIRTWKVSKGSFSELHHPLILENAKRQLCPDPDIRRMSGNEDASFSGFQVFGLRCPAEAATQQFFHALQCISGHVRASGDDAVGQGENLKS